jgi:hypothetical protein
MTKKSRNIFAELFCSLYESVFGGIGIVLGSLIYVIIKVLELLWVPFICLIFLGLLTSYPLYTIAFSVVSTVIYIVLKETSSTNR